MGIVLSAPGKTFLAGEYFAMEGGMALLAMTDPRFELRVENGTGLQCGIPAGSPAAVFLARYADFFADWDLEFIDPFAGAGGLGASTAQYLMVYAWQRTAKSLEQMDIDVKDLLASYQQDAWNGDGRAPSGADLVGQLKGGYTFFERSAGLISKSIWPFPQLEPYLLRTGVKVATHEHLRSLDETDFNDFAPIMVAVREAWNSARAEDFAEAISSFGRALAKRKLTVDTSLSILHDLSWLDGVKAAKGCGALGADVIFILVDTAAKRAFENWASDAGHALVRLTDHVSAGLEIHDSGVRQMVVGSSP